ncbi:hypothetical protein GCM10027037_31610 [Mucilaginibacter koreensis]
MLKKIFFITLLTAVLTSCSTYTSMLHANVKKVELGMAKAQVISIMGDTYRLSGLSQNINGVKKEAIWYPATQQSIFYFTFEGDKLIEWHEKFLISDKEELTK